MNADIKQAIYHIFGASLEVSPPPSERHPAAAGGLFRWHAAQWQRARFLLFFLLFSVRRPPLPPKTASAAPPRSASGYNEPHSLHLLPSRRPTCLCVLHLFHYINTGFVRNCPLKSPAGGCFFYPPRSLLPPLPHTHACILCARTSRAGSHPLLGECTNPALSLQTRSEVFAHFAPHRLTPRTFFFSNFLCGPSPEPMRRFFLCAMLEKVTVWQCCTFFFGHCGMLSFLVYSSASPDWSGLEHLRPSHADCRAQWEGINSLFSCLRSFVIARSFTNCSSRRLMVVPFPPL